VSELHKIRLFTYIPWTKYGLLTLFTATRTGLFANKVFSFHGSSYSNLSGGARARRQREQQSLLYVSHSGRQVAGRDFQHQDVCQVAVICHMCHNNRHNYTN
jgi:hypothetical protein